MRDVLLVMADRLAPHFTGTYGHLLDWADAGARMRFPLFAGEPASGTHEIAKEVSA